MSSSESEESTPRRPSRLPAKKKSPSTGGKKIVAAKHKSKKKSTPEEIPRKKKVDTTKVIKKKPTKNRSTSEETKPTKKKPAKDLSTSEEETKPSKKKLTKKKSIKHRSTSEEEETKAAKKKPMKKNGSTSEEEETKTPKKKSIKHRSTPEERTKVTKKKTSKQRDLSASEEETKTSKKPTKKNGSASEEETRKKKPTKQRDSSSSEEEETKPTKQRDSFSSEEKPTKKKSPSKPIKKKPIKQGSSSSEGTKYFSQLKRATSSSEEVKPVRIRRKRTSSEGIVPSSKREEGKAPFKEEKELTLRDIPNVILGKIAANLKPADRARLTAVGPFMNAYMATVAIDLFNRPMKLTTFTEYFKDRPTAKLIGLNLITKGKDDLTVLTPFLDKLERVRIDYTTPEGRAFPTDEINIKWLGKCANLQRANLFLDYRPVNLTVLAKCPKLTELTIRDYNSEGKPDISGCQNLQQLVIAGNNYPTKLLDSITQLPRLQVLQIIFCVEPFILPDLHSCPNLQTVLIHRCTKLADISGLANCNQLETLIIEDTKVRDFTAIGTCPNITALTISSPIAPIPIHTGIFQGLKRLRKIRFVNGVFSPDSSFEFFSALEELTLVEGTGIPTLPKIGAGLKILTLESLKLTELNSLPNSAKLEELSIVKCYDLQSVGFVEGCPHLKKLILNVRLPDTTFLTGHKFLDTLDINIEKMANLDWLEGYPQLKTLTLWVTPLQNLEGIAKCRSLEVLTLTTNLKLRTVAGIDNLPHLRELYIRGTPNVKFPPLAKCTTLTTVTLADIEVTNLDFLQNCSSITTLTLSNVPKVTELVPLVGLTELKLMGNIRFATLAAVAESKFLRTFSYTGHNVNYKTTGVSVLPLLKCLYLERVDFDSPDLTDVDKFMAAAPPQVESITTFQAKEYKRVQGVWVFK